METHWQTLTDELAERLLARRMLLASAESCTGGWVAKVLTDRAGSSAWFDRGFVTYSNRSKEQMLGVDPLLLERHGAVSEAVVVQMATGAIACSDAAVSLAISGIAGPGGGSDDKPVGTVWFAWAMTGREVLTRQCRFPGDREAVRRQAVETALQGLLEWLG